MRERQRGDREGETQGVGGGKETQGGDREREERHRGVGVP